MIATAAGTSAIVSLVTLWLWTPAPPRVDEADGSVSVTYELLDQERLQDARAGDAVGRAPAADVTSARAESGMVPASRPARTSLDTSPARATPRTADSENLDDTQAVPRISIITQPEGASVTINGVGYGTTPLAIPYLPPGAKRIRVTKAGYETEERYYSSDAGRASSLRITLREISRNGTR